jgi:hypothetical protein
VRQAENKEEMCKIISKREWFKVPAKDIVERAQGKFDYGNGKVVENSPHLMKFWAENASYPFKSHDLWFLTEDIRWGYIPAIPTRRSWLMQLTAKICGKKRQRRSDKKLPFLRAPRAVWKPSLMASSLIQKTPALI